LHTRVVVRHQLTADGFRLSQHRYDLSKLRAKGLFERIGKTRRYRLTSTGLKLGVLLVKIRPRFRCPLVSLIAHPTPHPSTRSSNSVDIPYRELDMALDHFSAAIGLKQAA
jgi:hypothetical protein